MGWGMGDPGWRLKEDGLIIGAVKERQTAGCMGRMG